MSKCRVSSSSSCVASSLCTTPWTWSRDPPSPNQRPSASLRPRSCSYTPDVQIPSPACNWRLRQLWQLRPVQPSKCYFSSRWPPSVHEILSPRQPNYIISNILYQLCPFESISVLHERRISYAVCLIKHNKFDMRAPFWTDRFLRWKD